MDDVYREDDLLAQLGEFLKEKNFFILALSGNQQGQYWFQMGENRKGPDIIAVKEEVVLVGESKLKSRDLFKTSSRKRSDYQALQYLMDNKDAYNQLFNMVASSLDRLGKKLSETSYIQPIIVGGDSFVNLKDFTTDERIQCISVDKSTGEVYDDGFFR